MTIALWSLIQDRTGLTNEERIARFNELDLADGVRDQRLTRPPVPCKKCGAMVGARLGKGLFCGQSLDTPGVF